MTARRAIFVADSVAASKAVYATAKRLGGKVVREAGASPWRTILEVEPGGEYTADDLVSWAFEELGFTGAAHDSRGWVALTAEEKEAGETHTRFRTQAEVELGMRPAGIERLRKAVKETTMKRAKSNPSRRYEVVAGDTIESRHPTMAEALEAARNLAGKGFMQNRWIRIITVEGVEVVDCLELKTRETSYCTRGSYERNADSSMRRAKSNRGKPPGAKKWIAKAITRPGKLGGKGFVSKPVAEQRQILDRCVRQYGYRSCLGSIMLLTNISKNPEHKERLTGLRQWLVAKYSPRKAAYRRNPDDGSWSAVPAIVVPFNVRSVSLTRAQIEEITAYT
jgi:hypothetical protein